MKYSLLFAAPVGILLLAGCATSPATETVARPRPADISQIPSLADRVLESSVDRQGPPASAPQGTEAAQRQTMERATRGMTPGAVHGGPRMELSPPATPAPEERPPLPPARVVTEPPKPELPPLR